MPRVGDVLAVRITIHRPYKSVEDLRNIKGITELLFNKLQPLVTVRGKGESEAMLCPACMKPVVSPCLKCKLCKESLPVRTGSGERDCLSAEAYRRGDCAPSFAPEEPLWAFKKGESSPLEVAAESELRRQFASSELDGSALVRGAFQNDFINADACPEFRDVAKPRPEPEPIDPLWEFKKFSSSVTQTAKQSELIQQFLDGRLDAETLVRKSRRGRFVPAGQHTLFASIARPRAVPPPLPSAPRPTAAPPPTLAPIPLPEPTPAPPRAESFMWRPAAVGVGSFPVSCLVGVALDQIKFLGSKVDNMAATFISAALISFFFYCLVSGACGRSRMFVRAAVVGGLLWLAVGSPMVSLVIDPSMHSKVLVHIFPLNWCAGLPEDDWKTLLMGSILVMPFIAGFVGSSLAAFGARYPRTARSLLTLYLAAIITGFAIAILCWKTGFAVSGDHTPGLAQLRQRTIPAGHRQSIKTIAISPQGNTLLSASGDGTINLGIENWSREAFILLG